MKRLACLLLAVLCVITVAPRMTSCLSISRSPLELLKSLKELGVNLPEGERVVKSMLPALVNRWDEDEPAVLMPTRYISYANRYPAPRLHYKVDNPLMDRLDRN